MNRYLAVEAVVSRAAEIRARETPARVPIKRRVELQLIQVKAALAKPGAFLWYCEARRSWCLSGTRGARVMGAVVRRLLPSLRSDGATLRMVRANA